MLHARADGYFGKSLLYMLPPHAWDLTVLLTVLLWPSLSVLHPGSPLLAACVGRMPKTSSLATLAVAAGTKEAALSGQASLVGPTSGRIQTAFERSMDPIGYARLKDQPSGAEGRVFPCY